MRDLRDEWDGVVPVPSGVTREFWAATTDGRLLVQRCSDCGEHQFYPRTVCTHCGARDPDYVEAAGTGEVVSYTVCHVPGAAGFGDHTPYAVAIVELAEGPRMTAHVTGDPDAVAVGAPVSVDFWRVSDDAAIPVFALD
ncbi:MAG: Zn-ribbon domain-containing OB-fold protein [Haloarculaceae archaeon]